MAMTITIEIDDTDEKILLNDLLDVKDWVEGAVVGKKSSCWSRFRQHWTTVMMDDPNFQDVIPSNKNDFVALVLARPDYKNRADRDIEAKMVPGIVDDDTSLEI
tara:strand:+ start:689 stop:1000 length:312 start_codon:yes stop_codon:yes gene_type:complete